jgi:hypothetical protein
VERVNPNFDDVGVMGGEGVDVGAGFVGGVGTVDLVEGYVEGRRSFGNTYALAGGE